MTARRARSGYVLLVVLLLGSLIVATTAAYARHAAVAWRQSTASLWVHQTRESAASGVVFARQVLAAGMALGTTTLSAGGKTVSVVVSDLGGDRRAIHVDATSSGLGSTIDAGARVFGVAGGTLPTLAAGAVSAALADPALITYSGNVTVQDTVLTGTRVLAPGCSLTLRDVVLHGSIVSQSALNGPPYDPALATTLTLEAGVRIEPTNVLPGCGILLPDGAVTSAAASRLEIHGAVLADTLALQGSGAMDGQIVTATACTLPAAIDRPGSGRAPLPWPAALTPGCWGLKSLAFTAATTSGAEVAAIKGFKFPAK